MQGIIVQVSVSPGGVPKVPVEEAFLTPAGLEGDACAHPEVHGGPRQAVLLVCGEVIEELTARGYPLFPGALGENLTIRGINRRLLRPGQRYRAGRALIELTRPRAPCSALDVYGPGLQTELYDSEVRVGDWRSRRWGMSGFYASVAQPGLIRRHDTISLVDEFA